MRYIRILVLGLFILTSVSYAGLKIYTEKTTDRTTPVLQCSSDITDRQREQHRDTAAAGNYSRG